MIFFPFGGALKGNLADPAALANELQEAHRIAQNCSQYQFQQESFKHANIEKGTHAKVEYVAMEADLGATNSAIPDLTTTNSDLYQITYMRGLEDIDIDTDWPTWTAEYPELVLCVFSFQYARRHKDIYNTGESAGSRTNIRAQIRLSIDGTILPGSGPAAIPIDGFSKGTGIGATSAASSIISMAILPAGSHRAVPMAGQASAIVQPGRNLEGLSQTIETVPPIEGVVIGNRSLLVLRFARGGPLGGD